MSNHIWRVAILMDTDRITLSMNDDIEYNSVWEAKRAVERIRATTPFINYTAVRLIPL